MSLPIFSTSKIHFAHGLLKPCLQGKSESRSTFFLNLKQRNRNIAFLIDGTKFAFALQWAFKTCPSIGYSRRFYYNEVGANPR